jgi:hypothetical protein
MQKARERDPGGTIASVALKTSMCPSRWISSSAISLSHGWQKLVAWCRRAAGGHGDTTALRRGIDTPFRQFIDDLRVHSVYSPGFLPAEDLQLMQRTRFFSFVVPATVAVLASALPAFAGDSVVKLAPTPMPAAGPTVKAAEAFCGDPSGKASELIQRYSTKPGLKQVYKSSQYIAYSDDDKNSSVMYTFTTKGNPAYPAAVCRKPVQTGNNIVITMSIVCDGDKDACANLKNDFNVMTAKMQADVDQKIEEQKK